MWYKIDGYYKRGCLVNLDTIERISLQISKPDFSVNFIYSNSNEEDWDWVKFNTEEEAIVEFEKIEKMLICGGIEKLDTPTFTTKTTGDIIESSHINKLQNEIILLTNKLNELINYCNGG